MLDFSIWDSSCKRILFALLIIAVCGLSLAAAQRYAVEMEGVPDTQLRKLDSGWYCETGESLSTIKSLPCNLNYEGNTLLLHYDFSEENHYPNDVLVIETRYQSIRVWADQKLVYESAKGKEYALSSMWHFIPAEKYRDAESLQIEIRKYDWDSEWQLRSIYQDHPAAVILYILKTHLPAVFVWLCCMLFTMLLIFVIFLMALRKITGIRLVLSLAMFIFLSGMWLLLDSKITTIIGGNYSLTYFLSYCIFYLLPIPLIIHLQLTEEMRSRVLHCLIWLIAANAGIWMLLHYLNLVPIRNTAWSVHLLIIIALAVILKNTLKNRRNLQQNHIGFTFWGILLVFTVALGSIVMYYTKYLQPSNSGVLYAWGLLVLILCMTVDTVLIFERMWKEKQHMEVYRQLATKDRMTGLENRNAYELCIRNIASQSLTELAFVLFDIDKMKNINDTYGHHAGDQVISLTAGCIDEIFGEAGDCFRIGGDEFCVILTSLCDIPQKLQNLDELIKARNKTSFPVSVSYGWAVRRFNAGKIAETRDIIELKTASDKMLYQCKKSKVNNESEGVETIDK